MTTKMVMGCTLAIGGFCIYSHARMYAKAQPPQASAADLEAAQQKVTAHAAQPSLSCPCLRRCGTCVLLPPGGMPACVSKRAGDTPVCSRPEQRSGRRPCTLCNTTRQPDQEGACHTLPHRLSET